jgi:hypothetical protein
VIHSRKRDHESHAVFTTRAEGHGTSAVQSAVALLNGRKRTGTTALDLGHPASYARI